MGYKKIELLFVLIISLILTSCKPDRLSMEYIATYNLNEEIYYEKYASSKGGVFASDTYYYYLTDSVKFRKYVDLCNEGEWIVIKKENGDIYNSYKYISTDLTKDISPKLIGTKLYNISKLRIEGRFE